MQNLLENLNEKQKEAVLKTEGPVLAIAGAGSGKTSVLTRRIAYLIYEKKVPHQAILAITFTNKAANEMKDRVYRVTGYNASRMWISTFHSFCAKILREHIELLGYKKSFQIIDDDDTVQLIKSLLKKRNYDIKMYPPKAIKHHVIKQKFDDTYIDYIEEPICSVARTIYNDYQTNLKDNNLVDFEDLLILTIKLLRQEDQIREYYHKMFQYVLIDEFQDTNNVQYELIKLLVNKNNNLFIVGDEDQSIYAFRGANIENIMKFKKDFPKHHLVLLEQNYRSTNKILEAANQIIKNNTKRIHKNLFSTRGEGKQITHYKGVTSRDEVEFVAMKILELKRKTNRSYNDFAVLYRANSTSRMFEEVLMQKQIPYRIYGNTSFFKRKEIKDFTSYLRLILNPNDAFSFLRAISAPKRGIGQVSIEKLFNYAVDTGLEIFDAIDSANQVLGKTMVNRLQDFKSMILDCTKQLNEIPFSEFVDYILLHSGYRKMLEVDDKGDVRYENLLEFKTILGENEEIYKDLSKEEMLIYLLEDISLKSEEKQSEIEDGVNLMTLHAAKGLEFSVVFIVTLENGMFPLHRAFGDRFEFEEERRLMYVGVTRAKDLLFLTNANTRQTYGETKQNDDSVFIREINPELLDIKGYSEFIKSSHRTDTYDARKAQVRQKVLEKKKESMASYQQNNLNKGDKIDHTVFGEGMVISVTGEQCIIAFSHPHGIKKLMKNHPAISKQ